MPSLTNTARGGREGKFAFRSRSASATFGSPGPCGVSPMRMANVGPITDTRGAHGAELEYNVLGGSQRGLLCVSDNSAMATLCRDGLAADAVGGGGRVKIWWYAVINVGCVCGVDSRDRWE